jgi:DNA-binding transcriptional regulator GbsR (MarR family)
MKLLDKPQRRITKDGCRLSNGRIVATVEQDKKTYYIVLTDCFNLLAPMTYAEVNENYDIAPEYTEAMLGGYEPYEATLSEFIEDIKNNIKEFEEQIEKYKDN